MNRVRMIRVFLHVLLCLVLVQGESTKDCEQTIKASKGVIKTPGYPNAYPANARCVWLIIVPEGFYVSLEFSTFDVEGEGTNCIDIVEVKDGENVNAPLIGAYCNIRMPFGEITSSKNSLRVWFSSDRTDNFRGFNASFKAIKDPGCGPSNLMTSTGTFQTPRFPDFFPNDVTCEWFITVPQGTYIRLTFLGYAMSCEDYLEVWDWKEDIMTSHGKYCLTLPTLIVSKSNKMKIKFSSSPENRFRGFKGSFTTSLTPGCGGDITGEAASIFSPNHPFGYPTYSNCVWRLRVPEERYISLRFNQYNIPDSSNKCFYDALEVREGYSRDSPLIGRYCNLNPPPIIRVEGRELFVQFTSGPGKYQPFTKIQAFTGTFLAHKPGCNEPLGVAAGDERVTDEQLFASSSGYVMTIDNKLIRFLPQYGRLNNINRAWCSQEARKGEYFQITFPSVMNITGVAIQGFFYEEMSLTSYVKKFSLQYHYEGSSYWIPYVDKSVYDSRLIYKVLDGNNDANTVVRVDLKPSILAKDLRFYPEEWQRDADYSSICMRTEVYGCEYSLGCGHTFLTDTSGYINSSAADRMGSAQCTWLSMPSPMLPANKRNAFIVDFLYFDIPCSGTLTLTNRMTSVEEGYCGGDRPEVVVMRPTDQLKITMKTPSTSSLTGFRMRYRKENLGRCGFLVDVKDKEGNLTSPLYPNKYQNKERCVWILMAKKNHRVKLSFQSFILQAKNGTKCMDYLEIRDGPLGSSEVVNKYCGNGIPKTLTSSGRYLRLTFISDEAIAEGGFVATYHSVEPVPAAVTAARTSGLRGGAIAFVVIFVIIMVLLITDLACCYFNKCGLIHMLMEREKEREQYQQASTDENKNNPLATSTPKKHRETAEAMTETSDLVPGPEEPHIYVNLDDPPPEGQAEMPVIGTITANGYEEVSLEVPDGEVTPEVPDVEVAQEVPDVEIVQNVPTEEVPPEAPTQIQETPKERKKSVTFKDDAEIAEELGPKEEFESAPSSPSLNAQRDKEEQGAADKQKKPSNLDIV